MKQPFYYQIPYPFPPVTFNLDAEDFPHLSLSYFLLVVISVFHMVTTKLNNYLLPPFKVGTYIVLISLLEINMEVNESHAHATSYLLLATCARVHHEA